MTRRPYDVIAGIQAFGLDELSRQVDDAARRFPAIARCRRRGRHTLLDHPQAITGLETEAVCKRVARVTGPPVAWPATP
jgi:hypothetical protein